MRLHHLQQERDPGLPPRQQGGILRQCHGIAKAIVYMSTVDTKYDRVTMVKYKAYCLTAFSDFLDIDTICFETSRLYLMVIEKSSIDL